MLCVATVCLARPAKADRELIVPFHESGHLVFDQLSGLQVSPLSGASYAGPVGVSIRTDKADAFTSGTPADETKITTFWFAPSADLFVTDHLSVGAYVEIAHTSGSVKSAGQSVDLPGSTSFTFMPRIGFYAPIGDRLGVWPRASLGYASIESASFASSGGVPQSATFRSMLLDVDVSLTYRFTEVFFLRVGPKIDVTLGGRHEISSGGVSAGADASSVNVSGVLGFGANVEL